MSPITLPAADNSFSASRDGSLLLMLMLLPLSSCARMPSSQSFSVGMSGVDDDMVACYPELYIAAVAAGLMSGWFNVPSNDGDRKVT